MILDESKPVLHRVIGAPASEQKEELLSDGASLLLDASAFGCARVTADRAVHEIHYRWGVTIHEAAAARRCAH